VKGNFHARFLGGCGRVTAHTYPVCDMKSHPPLLSMGNLTKPCLSRQVFQGSMRWTGGGNATVQGLKPSRQCSQPGSLNPGAALESDGMVKLNEHSQAPSEKLSHTRLIKAQTKMVSGQDRVVQRGPTRMTHRRCTEWT
jgi:hypothetical protein